MAYYGGAAYICASGRSLFALRRSIEVTIRSDDNQHHVRFYIERRAAIVETERRVAKAQK